MSDYYPKPGKLPYQVLQVLAERGPMRHADIREALNIRPLQFSKAVKLLVPRGLVVRERAPGLPKCSNVFWYAIAPGIRHPKPAYHYEPGPVKRAWVATSDKPPQPRYASVWGFARGVRV